MKSRTPRRGARRSVFPSFVQSPRGPSAARSKVKAKAKVTFHNCPKDTPFPAAPSSAFFAKPLFAPPTTPPPKPPNPRLRPGKRCPRPPMRPSPGCHRRASIRPARLVAADELEGARFVDWDTHKRMEEMADGTSKAGRQGYRRRERRRLARKSAALNKSSKRFPAYARPVVWSTNGSPNFLTHHEPITVIKSNAKRLPRTSTMPIA